MSAHRWREFVVFVFAVLAFGYAFSSCSKTEEKAENIPTETVPANTAEVAPAPPVDPNADYSKFQHFNQAHAELSCLMCHRSEDNQQATPKLPGHTPCAGCHSVQFADNNNSVCTICHTDAQTGGLKNFPALKSFNVVFDHAKHLRQTNCATCHTPSKRGVALSIPAKFSAHNSCFQCHAPGTEIGAGNTQSCATCHRQGSPPRAVSESAKAFSLGFSHGEHRGLSCTNCHTVRAGAARGRQVTSIVAAMHFPPKNAQSCATCHNNKRAFGGTDFGDCKRCHQGNNFGF